ncbi:hypothetical protein PR202_gb25766 [Eleusine coracana subsp. coracana]|uniref:Lactoylglutathione lyase n=1 Tax=Eleusine coracana subsp. coracana TaxID=191504 RepID=A0AAV5FQD0_ELECO|nr:hypothetical protein PR202_gb25766 [Eleusine coracana subsp. coracana]
MGVAREEAHFLSYLNLNVVSDLVHEGNGLLCGELFVEDGNGTILMSLGRTTRDKDRTSCPAKRLTIFQVEAFKEETTGINGEVRHGRWLLLLLHSFLAGLMRSRGGSAQLGPFGGSIKGIAFIKDPDGYWIEIFDENIGTVTASAS